MGLLNCASVPGIRNLSASGLSLTAAVVAGSELLRTGLERLLRAVPNIGVVWECTSSEELGSLLARERPDVLVVVAADMPWLAGLRETVAATGATVLVVVDRAAIGDFTSYASFPASGFLCQRDLSAAGLQDALSRSRNGEVPMPPDLARSLLARVVPAGRNRARGVVKLTWRERQALSLLVQGLSNKEIAKELSISSHGAKRLVTSIMIKLNAPNRTVAAVTAVRDGIVDGP